MQIEVRKSAKFDRDDDVEIHVRKVALDEDEVVIEIREWLKNGEVWGHGVLIPFDQFDSFYSAFDKVAYR